MKPFILVIFAGVFVLGCTSSEPPESSEFLQKLNLESVIRLAAKSEVNLSREFQGGTGADRQLGTDTTSRADIVMPFQCEPGSLEQFATSVINKLQTEIEANGGTATPEVPKNHDWTSKDFRFDYEIGAAKGTIQIAIAIEDESPSRSKEYPFLMEIRIDETVKP